MLCCKKWVSNFLMNSICTGQLWPFLDSPVQVFPLPSLISVIILLTKIKSRNLNLSAEGTNGRPLLCTSLADDVGNIQFSQHHTTCRLKSSSGAEGLNRTPLLMMWGTSTSLTFFILNFLNIILTDRLHIFITNCELRVRHHRFFLNFSLYFSDFSFNSCRCCSNCSQRSSCNKYNILYHARTHHTEKHIGSPLNFVCSLSEKLEAWSPINESQIHKVCGGERLVKSERHNKRKVYIKKFCNFKVKLKSDKNDMI